MKLRKAAGRYGVAKEINETRIQGGKDKLGNISRT